MFIKKNYLEKFVFPKHFDFIEKLIESELFWEEPNSFLLHPDSRYPRREFLLKDPLEKKGWRYILFILSKSEMYIWMNQQQPKDSDPSGLCFLASSSMTFEEVFESSSPETQERLIFYLDLFR